MRPPPRKNPGDGEATPVMPHEFTYPKVSPVAPAPGTQGTSPPVPPRPPRASPAR